MSERSERIMRLRNGHDVTERSEVAACERSERIMRLGVEHGAAERSEVAA
ncbi:hypothetical protein [Polymorphospora rubra]|nr:hypothetical protein [Polymorphospora rubra]